jgi:hypothetical protein
MRLLLFVLLAAIAHGAAWADAAPAGAEEAPHPHAAMPPSGGMGYTHGAMKKSPQPLVTKVPKAEAADARTVAEVNTNGAALKDRAVTVRAQVVKVSNVLGKHWVHLRDGSGSSADGSDDLLVTSAAEPKIGDVVVAKGTVKTDVDIGNGYMFKVLVEDVSFSN